MITCIYHPALCQATRAIRTNTHQCFLGPDHDGPHVCCCYYRWPAEDQEAA